MQSTAQALPPFDWNDEPPVVFPLDLPPVFYGPYFPYRLNRLPVVARTAQDADDLLQHVEPGMVVGLDIEFKAQLEPGQTRHICTIQIATPLKLVVIDMSAIPVLPIVLQWILESSGILKVGVGMQNDGAFLHRDFNIVTRGLCDVGFMIRIAYPERFARVANNVSLQSCVEHVFSLVLPKNMRRTYDWRLGIPAPGDSQYLEVVHYAAADAEAALELYYPVLEAVEAKARFLRRHLPRYWYTYNSFGGQAVCIVADANGDFLPWSWTICPWYVGGVFTGYWM
ncbi:ribonuclease H-like domain-containing protein [Favolaschia claudopus]|uniref:Ribonuclease H-like domain-containing protein n=1 Tax=Favolaschia claudopus TaxID=2862362 RepID=A0AAV9ZVW8_9AGAR